MEMAKTWLDIQTQKETIRLTDVLPLIYLSEFESGGESENASISNQGVDGIIPGTNVYPPFQKKFQLVAQTRNSSDLKMLKRELKKILAIPSPFWIQHEREPGHRFHVNQVNIEWGQVLKNSFRSDVVTLTFNVFKGYAESWATTLDPMFFSTEKWAMGLNLPLGENLAYTHTTKNFRIYNASSHTIDPRKRHQLNIALTCIGQPTITNYSTGDYFTYYKTLKKSDVLAINGVYPYKNGTHCGVDSNHGLLTLLPGWNEFEISGAENIKVSFDFPFIYR